MINGISKITQLISDKVPESLTLDYKQQLPGKSDDDKKEFAADVASFMNAMGGQLIYGVSESKKLPVDIVPLVSVDRDAEERRLNQILLDKIEPRGEYSFEWFDVEGGSVLFLIIPPSAYLPHRVSHNKHAYFLVRDNVGKHPMSMDELRNKFRRFNIAKSKFEEEVVQLAESFSEGAVILKDKIFENCVLKGPANVMISGKANFRSMGGVEIVVIKRGAQLKNVILLDQCILDNCDLSNVTLYLMPEQYALLSEEMKSGIPVLTKI